MRRQAAAVKFLHTLLLVGHVLGENPRYLLNPRVSMFALRVFQITFCARFFDTKLGQFNFPCIGPIHWTDFSSKQVQMHEIQSESINVFQLTQPHFRLHDERWSSVGPPRSSFFCCHFFLVSHIRAFKNENPTQFWHVYVQKDRRSCQQSGQAAVAWLILYFSTVCSIIIQAE